jgi:hypothetical protein
MDRKFQDQHYTSKKVKDRREGYEGYELLCHSYGETVSVARIVYWDAAPGFFVEMFNSTASVPLDIFEAFIFEATANMTAEEWMECDDPGKLLGLVHGLASGRKLRLLSVACCRGVDTSAVNYRKELEAVERLADGLLTTTECEEALADLHPIVATFISAYQLLEAATSTEHWNAACYGASKAGIATESQNRSLWQYRNPRYSTYIREVFGNPFRSVVFAPAWRTTDVVALAEGIYQERAFDRMPILADALQDAGCNNEDILNHCRQAGEHIRGCWVIDLLTGRK